MDQILYTKPKMMEALGIGEDVFDAMHLPPIPIKEREYYDIFALYDWIIENRRHPNTGKKLCRSTRGQIPSIGSMTSQSKVVDFAEALKLTAADAPKQ